MYVVFLVYVTNYLVLVVCVRACVCVSRMFLCFYYLTLLHSVRNNLYIMRQFHYVVHETYRTRPAGRLVPQ